MIAIHWSSYEKYGCPHCGCDSAGSGNVRCGGTQTGICRECGTEFIILSDGIYKSEIGIGTADGSFEYPEVQEHPRKGTAKHQYIKPDIRPEYGEYWSPRGIGYDLSGFVKSKQAGERLMETIKEVLGKENPGTWLDYREYEPDWIQLKFQSDEFDLEKLEEMVLKNNKILTKEILEACKK